jgi:hypothetical protein
MKKFITVPADISVKDPVSKEDKGISVSFREFVIGTLLADKRFAGSYQAIKSALTIDECVGDCAVGGVVSLPLEAWQKLKDSAENPTEGAYCTRFNAVGLMQLVPFMEAIIGAADKA